MSNCKSLGSNVWCRRLTGPSSAKLAGTETRHTSSQRMSAVTARALAWRSCSPALRPSQRRCTRQVVHLCSVGVQHAMHAVPGGGARHMHTAAQRSRSTLIQHRSIERAIMQYRFGQNRAPSGALHAHVLHKIHILHEMGSWPCLGLGATWHLAPFPWRLRGPRICVVRVM